MGNNVLLFGLNLLHNDFPRWPIDLTLLQYLLSTCFQSTSSTRSSSWKPRSVSQHHLPFSHREAVPHLYSCLSFSWESFLVLDDLFTTADYNHIHMKHWVKYWVGTEICWPSYCPVSWYRAFLWLFFISSSGLASLGSSSWKLNHCAVQTTSFKLPWFWWFFAKSQTSAWGETAWCLKGLDQRWGWWEH